MAQKGCECFDLFQALLLKAPCWTEPLMFLPPGSRDLNKNNICAHCLTQGRPGQPLHLLGTTMTGLFAIEIAGQVAATPVPNQSSLNKLSLLLCL